MPEIGQFGQRREGRYRARQRIVANIQALELRECDQRGQTAAEAVGAQTEPLQRDQRFERRDGAIQPVGAEVERDEAGQRLDGRRNRAAQTVRAEPQLRHTTDERSIAVGATRLARDAIPRAHADRIRHPVGIVLPLSAAGGVVQFNQRGAIGGRVNRARRAGGQQSAYESDNTNADTGAAAGPHRT